MLFTGTDVFWKPVSLPALLLGGRRGWIRARSQGPPSRPVARPRRPRAAAPSSRPLPLPGRQTGALTKGPSLCFVFSVVCASLSCLQSIESVEAPSKQTAVRDGVGRWLAWPGCRRGLAGAGAGGQQREPNRRRGCEARICLVSSRGFLSWIKAQARGSRNRPPGDASALRGPLLLAFLLALDASSEASPAPALETRGRETWGEIRLRPALRERPLRALGRGAGAAPLHGQGQNGALFCDIITHASAESLLCPEAPGD